MPRRKRPLGQLPSLSPLELEVMNVVWDLGPCTSAQVTEAFVKKRALAPTTIRTVLANLREKGYVAPVPTIGRAFLLKPTVPRESVARRTLKDVITSLLGNSPRQAIAYLLDDADMTERDLDEIRRMLDARKHKGG